VGHNNNTDIHTNMDYCVIFQQASDFYRKIIWKNWDQGFSRSTFISFFEKFITLDSFT